MTSNWVKECGVAVGGCDMCLLLDVANERLKQEVAEGEELAVELAQERANYRREAIKYRQYFRLATAGFALWVFIQAVVTVAGR